MVAERRCGSWLPQHLQRLAIACVLVWTTPCLAQEAVSAPSTANALHAQDTEPNPPLDEARDSFALGAALARHGQWVDALVAFERSYRLHPHVTTLFNIGFCERALGRFTRARKSFRAALAKGEADRRELREELAVEAQGYLEEVERRIVRATVVIRQPSLRLTINGRPLEAETSQPKGRTFFVAGTRDAGPPEVPPVAVFELLLDPGEQAIVISTDGVDHVVTRRFEPGSAPRIELSVPAPAPRPAASDEPGRPMAQLALPAIAYGVGAAGVVVGAVFGVATLQNAKTLSNECPQKNACPEDARADMNASKRNAIVSNVGFGVGLVSAMVGTWLLLTSQPKESVDAQRASRAIRARLGLARVNIEGSF